MSARQDLAPAMPAQPLAPAASARALRIGILTGADDRSYALGLSGALMERGLYLDFIGSNDVDGPLLHGNPQARFLNLRGDQSRDAPLLHKVGRLLRYYLRLMRYAASCDAEVLHILWNNKFQHFDRTLLMLYYRAFGRRIAHTAHNVNAARRDGRDTALNRLTLRIQYRLCDHIFVHTQKMHDELRNDFGVPSQRISVIPFGINSEFPDTTLTGAQARERLGLAPDDKVMLFFGQIAPYKGLEYLVDALPALLQSDPRLKLVIAGKVKAGHEAYWQRNQQLLQVPGVRKRVLTHVKFIPDDDVELYFKAADVLVMPYVQIFQSGVPFLAFNYGLPVVATDVGALREDVVEGINGFLCEAQSPQALAGAVKAFFGSALYRELPARRATIRDHANEHHSWRTVAEITEAAYRRILPR